MKVTFESKGGFDNVLKWMQKITDIPTSEIKNLADYGLSNLSQNTPKDTGETADGWEYEVVKTPNGIEIDWTNIAHPESEVSVAKLIEFGHGTKTGGYIAPRPYIKQAMEPVWNKLDKDIEEMMK
jgi:hypothetical protein